MHGRIEVELEGIVLADVWTVPLIFKRVVEQAKAAASYQLPGDLVVQAKTRSKVLLLRLQESLPVPIGFVERDAICRQKVDQAPASHSLTAAGEPVPAPVDRVRLSFPAGWKDKRRIANPLRRQGDGNEVGLASILLVDRAEVIPTDAEIQRQLRGHLPVVFEVGGKVHFLVVGFADVGGVDTVGSAGIAEAVWIWVTANRCGRRHGRQQHLGHAAVGASLIRDVSEVAGVVPGAARPGRLQSGELHVLVLDAHFETVLAVDAREVIGDLEGSGGFVGRQVIVAAQIGQVADVEVGQPAVFSNLGNTLNPILRRNPHLAAHRPIARGVQVGKTRPDLVHNVGAEYVGVCRHHLGRFRGLKALLEGAAVGYACKRPGNELRVVGIAEAGEHLVIVVRVEVSTRIEFIGVFVQGRAVLVGAFGRTACIRRRIKLQQLHRVGIDAAGRQLVEVGTGSNGNGRGPRSAHAAERIAHITVGA